MTEKIAAIRKEAYLEYLDTTYKLRDNRALFTEEKEVMKKKAFNKYKQVEAKCDAIEDMLEMEQIERDTIDSLKCPY